MRDPLEQPRIEDHQHITLPARDLQSTRRAKQLGLDCTDLKQVGTSLVFEPPARLSTATVIGRCQIGAFSYVGGGSELRNVQIGRFCSIAANVALGPAEHPLGWVSSHPVGFDGVRYFDRHEDWESFAARGARFKGNAALTVIGNDVWIGRNAIVRQGVTVGDGAVIAGGAFVNQDVPPYAIVAGMPAKVIRSRFPVELIELLLALRWWTWRLEPDRHGLDYDDPEQFVRKLRKLLEQRTLQPFAPHRYAVAKAEDGYTIARTEADQSATPVPRRSLATR